MSTVNFLEDSQQSSQRTEVLFDPTQDDAAEVEDQQHGHDGPDGDELPDIRPSARRANAIDLNRIFAELKSLREMVEPLKGMVASLQKEVKQLNKSQQERFTVQRSGFQAQIDEWLKVKFGKNFWLKDDDSALKNKVVELLESKGYGCSPDIVRTCVSYALNKFTHWRSDVKRKITGLEPSSKEIEGMDLNDLADVVTGVYKDPMEDRAALNQRRVQVLLLKTYCYKQKFLPSQRAMEATRPKDFWGGFLQFKMDVGHDRDKLEALSKTNERRIQRFLNQNEMN